MQVSVFEDEDFNRLKASSSVMGSKHCPLLVGVVALLQALDSAAAFKASVCLPLGLLDCRQGDSWGCLSPCLLNIIRNYRQNVSELFPDAGNQMSIAAQPDCLPTFSQGFADLIKTTWGDNLRLDLIISNIITTGKPTVVEPRPHGNTDEQEDGRSPDPSLQILKLRPTNKTLSLNKCL